MVSRGAQREIGQIALAVYGHTNSCLPGRLGEERARASSARGQATTISDTYRSLVPCRFWDVRERCRTSVLLGAGAAAPILRSCAGAGAVRCISREFRSTNSRDIWEA